MDALTVRARELAADGRLPAYVYDLAALDAHAAAVRAALPGIELYYAAKANPDPELLRVLARHVDGVEVASGGELEHVLGVLPSARIAFGGPGKTDGELRLALDRGVERLHVESPNELCRLIATGREADVLLRANLALSLGDVALAMGGGATPSAWTRPVSTNVSRFWSARTRYACAAFTPTWPAAWTPRACWRSPRACSTTPAASA